MGTRSLTIIKGTWEWEGKQYEEEIVVMYRQMDGYPTGHGKELAEFLADTAVVNGLNINNPLKVFNGAHCGAAQIVAYFKDGPGGIYLHPAKTRKAGEEYRYYVTIPDKGVIGLKAVACKYSYKKDSPTFEHRIRERVLYNGTPEGFLENLVEIDKEDRGE